MISDLKTVSEVGGRTAVIPAIPADAYLTTLDNGLTVIVREDHSAPVVSAQAWCRAGSVDEGRWLGAGLSHLLEHMLFKGTTTRGAGRIDQEVQAAGGYLNAYTSFDRTVFWINVPNTGARVAVDILCDVMQHATVPAEELVQEMDVIRREMDMCHDDPSRRASRRLFEVAYTRSPYRYTVIGYPDIFNALTREDIVGYYREKYAPNNLFYVVVGDVDAREIGAQIAGAFAQVKSRPLPPAVLPVEPRQLAPREAIEEGPIELGHTHLAWHIPEVRHPDVPLLDVLAVVLGSGRSSRLFREVHEKQALVEAVDAWTYSPGDPGLFGLSGVMEAGKFASASAAMLAEVERLQQDLVSTAELSKAVKQAVSAQLATRKTMQGQAQDLGGNWLIASDLNFSTRYLAAVQRATPDELRRVARQYLTAENRTHYALLPKGGVPQRVAERSSQTDHPIQRTELANGLRLLVKEDRRLPFVELRVVLRGGVLAEEPARNGATVLLAKLLLQGTTTRTAEELALALEAVGGHLDTYSGNNSLGVTAEVLRDDFRAGLDVVMDVLLHPTLPLEAIERERQNQLAGIRAQRDQVLPCALRAMRRELFGPRGYGLDPLGTESTVAGLRREDLSVLHQRLTAPQQAVLAVYGDVDAAAVTVAVRDACEVWGACAEPEATSASPRAAAVAEGARACGSSALRRVREIRDKQQAVVVLGFPGTSLLDPDRFALDLIQEACSDMGSRLFLRIRDRLGLAYYVGAQNFLGLTPGYFAFYAGTAPERVAQVEAELLAEAEWLGREGLTAEEVSRAKAKLIGQKKIARQDLGSLALTTALDELYGLGYANIDTEDAHYEAVTGEQLKDVARRFLRAERAVLVCLGPETGAAGASVPGASD